jgi:hypothetical protein
MVDNTVANPPASTVASQPVKPSSIPSDPNTPRAYKLTMGKHVWKNPETGDIIRAKAGDKVFLTPAQAKAHPKRFTPWRDPEPNNEEDPVNFTPEVHNEEAKRKADEEGREEQVRSGGQNTPNATTAKPIKQVSAT